MRNLKGSFYRTDETSHEPSQCADWLEAFALDLQAKTAVQVARERQQDQPSVFEMMSAIVGGQKPKYSSVEEAVKDYQRQTGLSEYLKRAGNEDMSSLASQILTASEETEECAVDDEGDVRDMTDEEQEDNPVKKKLISEAEEGTPKILQQNPAMEQFLKNIIDSHHGITLPAVLNSLIETFHRDGIDFSIYSDEDLLGWINQKLIDKGAIRIDPPTNLGRGVGVQVDHTNQKDPNKDPFLLLVPDKSSM